MFANAEVAKVLIQYGADVHAMLCTNLSHFSSSGSVDVPRCCFSHSADVILLTNGISTLHYHKNEIAKINRKHADVNVADDFDKITAFTPQLTMRETSLRS